MNENINLTKILKNCPKGTEFYSSLFEKVIFDSIAYHRIIIECVKLHRLVAFNQDGKYLIEESKNNGTCFSSECLLFPSKDQRDWNKFSASWYKKDKFDPKTLQPFDKVLCWNGNDCVWECDFFSYYKKNRLHPCVCINGSYIGVIPYNDETQKFVGTSKIVPEFYCYWED